MWTGKTIIPSNFASNHVVLLWNNCTLEAIYEIHNFKVIKGLKGNLLLD